MSLQLRRPFCTNCRIMLTQNSGSCLGLPFSSTPSVAFSSWLMNSGPCSLCVWALMASLVISGQSLGEPGKKTRSNRIDSLRCSMKVSLLRPYWVRTTSQKSTPGFLVSNSFCIGARFSSTSSSVTTNSSALRWPVFTCCMICSRMKKFATLASTSLPPAR